jgi:hypothetical protein
MRLRQRGGNQLDADSYAERMRSRYGAPKRSSIARSVIRCPPCAAGSMRTNPVAVTKTLPDHRSPWMRAGGASSSYIPWPTLVHTLSITASPSRSREPRAYARSAYAQQRCSA